MIKENMIKINDKIWVKNPPEGKPNPGLITEIRKDSVLAKFDTYYEYVVPYKMILKHEKNIEKEKRLALKVLEAYKSDMSKNEYEKILEKVKNNNVNTIRKLKDSIFLEDGFKIELGLKFHRENKYPGKIPNISADGVDGSLNKALSKEYGIKLNKEELIGVHNEIKAQKKSLGVSR